MTRSRGIIADRIAQRRECANPVAAQTENSSTEGRMRTTPTGADTPSRGLTTTPTDETEGRG